MGRVKTIKLFVLVVSAAAVLSLAACGGGGQQSDAPPEGNGADTQQTNSSGEGSEGFSVRTLEGEQFDLSGGQDEVVALYFMAGW